MAEDVDYSFTERPTHAKQHLTEPTTIGTEEIPIDKNAQSVALCVAADVISLSVNRPKQTALL
jgi:hypothetical protein